MWCSNSNPWELNALSLQGTCYTVHGDKSLDKDTLIKSDNLSSIFRTHIMMKEKKVDSTKFSSHLYVQAWTQITKNFSLIARCGGALSTQRQRDLWVLSQLGVQQDIILKHTHHKQPPPNYLLWVRKEDNILRIQTHEPLTRKASLNYKPRGHIRQCKRMWWGYNLLYLPHGYETDNKNINSKLDVVAGTIITAPGRLW